jgi:hypothetical protein
MPKITGKAFRVTATRKVFPIDMLRYDNCWPRTSQDAMDISWSIGNGSFTGTIALYAPDSRTITPTRWASFGWTVEG